MTTEWWSGAGLALALASMGVVSGAAKAAKARARRDARRAAVEEKRREMRARFARERAGGVVVVD